MDHHGFNGSEIATLAPGISLILASQAAPAFPKTDVQLYIVHMVRNSLKFVPWKDRKIVARDLKEVYRAANVEKAEAQLRLFAEKWDTKSPTISKSWQNHWNNIIPFFTNPPEIRKAIYTTCSSVLFR